MHPLRRHLFPQRYSEATLREMLAASRQSHRCQSPVPSCCPHQKISPCKLPIQTLGGDGCDDGAWFEGNAVFRKPFIDWLCRYIRGPFFSLFFFFSFNIIVLSHALVWNGNMSLKLKLCRSFPPVTSFFPPSHRGKFLHNNKKKKKKRIGVLACMFLRVLV